MAERFYSISHLSTEQLRELFNTYRSQGWVDCEYDKQSDAPELSDAEILLNIEAGNDDNYCVFMLDHEDEEDGVMIGFRMSYHSELSAYLHLPPELLDEIVNKYSLPVSPNKNSNPIWEYLDETLKISLN